MLRFLSLGAGIQSSALAVMISRGDINLHVDYAIFADTQWERRGTYEWLDWLEPQLSFPVHRVTEGNLRTNVLTSKNTTGGRFATIPWFITNPDGSAGMGRRQCTSEYKLKPLRREKRRLLGYAPGLRIPRGACETLIGISTDEALRMKPSTERWSVNRWPLIEDRKSRNDCAQYLLRALGRLPPKSACTGCPFHDDNEWRSIMADPIDRADVLEIDTAIREPVRGQRGQQFMHAKRVPMAEVDLSTAADHGQIDAFINECEGLCGV